MYEHERFTAAAMLRIRVCVCVCVCVFVNVCDDSRNDKSFYSCCYVAHPRFTCIAQA